MGKESSIQWTDATWNIARGCTKVDADCKFCYMYRDALNETRYNPKIVQKTKTVFDSPLKWKEPKKIFTSSLTDVFHEDIDSFRHEVWDIIKKCPHHTFQMLTKRPERLDVEHGLIPNEYFGNIWLGTSIGSHEGMKRAHQLVHARVPVRLKFLSIEPLHDGPLNLYYPLSSKQIKWVIVGGESGNEKGLYRYRPCELSWIENIVDQCRMFGVPVFVKQLGTHLAKEMGLKDRHGGDINEWPEHLRIREFPRV